MISRRRAWLTQLRACAAIATASFLLLAACSSERSEPSRGPVVLAAASTQEALTEIAEAWAGYGHASPIVSFASTPSVARQADNRAPADVVVLADTRWMDFLVDRKRVRPETVLNVASNRLVLVTKRDPDHRNLHFENVQQALKTVPGRIAMAEPDSVPAGRYAKEALVKIGIWPSITSRIAPAENVRAALSLLDNGEVEIAAVYASDAKAASDSSIVASFADESHQPIVYPAAILSESSHDDAQGFMKFLGSEQAQSIFLRHGFRSPRGM